MHNRLREWTRGAECVFDRSSGDVDKVKDVARGLVDVLVSGIV